MNLLQKQKIKRICVVRMGGMGDILLATPAVRALSRHFTDADGNAPDIDFIVGRGMKDALTGISYIRNIIEFDKKGAHRRPAAFASFLREVKQARYDLFVNFHPSVKTFLMAVASGAPSVLTFRKDRRRQPDTGRVRHAVDDFTKELRPLGIAHVDDRRLDFVVPDAAHAAVNSLLQAEGIDERTPLVAVNPAASHEVNRWGMEKFVGLFENIAARMPGVRLVLTGGPGDVPLVNEIFEATDPEARIINLAGRVSIKELGALLARADVFVTGDTGPMHIASAVGTPLVALFGPADPDRTGPIGARHLVVVHNEGLSCVPCQLRYCARGDHACMADLSVERVVDAVRRQLPQSSIVEAG